MKRIDVAAAVLIREDGAFLLGQRPEGTPYAGYWEFPGGKLEPDETPEQALRRELEEELGIVQARVFPWITLEHHYAHAHVRLYCFEVRHFFPGPNHLQRHVHSALHWQENKTLPPVPMLPTNARIFKALAMPRRMGITATNRLGGVAKQIKAAQHALENGFVDAIQLREPDLSLHARAQLACALLPLTRAHAAPLILNGAPEEAQALGLEGVHLTAQRLMALQKRPDLTWVGASCHTALELEKACAHGLDYALLGPVCPTPTHPGVAGLGWRAFASLVALRALPVLALGGVDESAMDTARAHGAHGVAGIRGFWPFSAH